LDSEIGCLSPIKDKTAYLSAWKIQVEEKNEQKVDIQNPPIQKAKLSSKWGGF
jgi:hypothetical protein